MRIHVKPCYQPQQEFSLEEVNAMLSRGDLNGNEPAWTPGLTEWTILRNIHGIILPQLPPQIDSSQTQISSSLPKPMTQPQATQIAAPSHLPNAVQSQSSPHTPKRKISSQFIIISTLILILVAIILFSKWVGRTVGRKAAMRDVAHQASALGAPTGVLDTKWLMSMTEVKGIVPNAENEGPNKLIEYRDFYEREAKISYGFENDLLLIVIVTFRGQSSKAQYLEIQRRLVTDYGPMSEPAAIDQFPLHSKRQVDRFIIEHMFYDIQGAPKEQVLFYRTK